MKKHAQKPKAKRVPAKRTQQGKTVANGEPLEKQLRYAYARRACGQPAL
jgi:hypothetical protein